MFGLGECCRGVSRAFYYDFFHISRYSSLGG
jgi:hypothetical protein